MTKRHLMRRSGIVALLVVPLGLLAASHARAKLRVLTFPKPWTRADISRTVLTQPAHFELRTLENPPSAVVISLRDAIGNPGLDYYRVTLPDLGKAVSAPEHEFLRASTPSGPGGLPLNSNIPTRRSVPYENHVYECSGDIFAQPGALMSPGKKTLLMFSYKKGKAKAGTFMGQGEPSRGKLYVDVFDLKTGKRIDSFSSTYEGVGPSILFSNARWYGDHYFIIPLDFMCQKALLGVVRSENE